LEEHLGFNSVIAPGKRHARLLVPVPRLDILMALILIAPILGSDFVGGTLRLCLDARLYTPFDLDARPAHPRLVYSKASSCPLLFLVLAYTCASIASPFPLFNI